MTKARAPVSFAQAISRIAGQLGYDASAAIVERSVRTVYQWADPDSGTAPTVAQALKLDVAYQAAGGDGAPMFDTYAARLDRETTTARADLEALAISTAATAKETGEAVAALVLASRPGATFRDRAKAEAETEEAMGALSNSLRQLGAMPTDKGSEAGRVAHE